MSESVVVGESDGKDQAGLLIYLGDDFERLTSLRSKGRMIALYLHWNPHLVLRSACPCEASFVECGEWRDKCGEIHLVAADLHQREMRQSQ